jgi:hypothetical protein
MKLLRIEPARNPKKKYRAIFIDHPTGRQKAIEYGAANMDDYTLTHDKEQRERYRARHAKDLKTPNNQTGVGAGALSYYTLWGDSTSMAKNVIEYKKLFNL